MWDHEDRRPNPPTLHTGDKESKRGGTRAQNDLPPGTLHGVDRDDSEAGLEKTQERSVIYEQQPPSVDGHDRPPTILFWWPHGVLTAPPSNSPWRCFSPGWLSLD